MRAPLVATRPLQDSVRWVNVQMQDGGHQKYIALRIIGKGDHERVVPLYREGENILRDYMTWRREHTDPEWMFPGKTGHIKDRTLRAALQRVREPLGMKFTSHTMRRTYLTSLLRSGMDSAYVAKIAGHADVRTLVEHYLALDEYDIVRAFRQSGGKLSA